mmetsp:Transcript_1235/g.3283  ORF Transcript_1235/g.3283 Transcript_1235/m.3283 type:complete len:202 (-) Transcript_1235:111-716(-)
MGGFQSKGPNGEDETAKVMVVGPKGSGKTWFIHRFQVAVGVDMITGNSTLVSFDANRRMDLVEHLASDAEMWKLHMPKAMGIMFVADLSSAEATRRSHRLLYSCVLDVVPKNMYGAPLLILAATNPGVGRAEEAREQVIADFNLHQVTAMNWDVRVCSLEEKSLAVFSDILETFHDWIAAHDENSRGASEEATGRVCLLGY